MHGWINVVWTAAAAINNCTPTGTRIAANGKAPMMGMRPRNAMIKQDQL
jgi:hypothetical protein